MNNITHEFLDQIKIYDVGLPKVRIGHPNDGGYILLEPLLDGVEVVYSFGVEEDVTFDIEFGKRYGSIIRLYDHTIECIPQGEKGGDVPHGIFYKQGIGSRTDGDIDTLQNYVDENNDNGKRMILKMDVEGCEWDSLYCCSDELLCQFEHILMECHGHQFPYPNLSTDHYGQQLPYEVLKKLNKNFYMFHAHPNNWGWNEPIGEYKIPTLLELSLVRKDLVKDVELYTGSYPTDVDGRNNPNRPDVDINFWPFVRK